MDYVEVKVKYSPASETASDLMAAFLADMGYMIEPAGSVRGRFFHLAKSLHHAAGRLRRYPAIQSALPLKR